MISYLVLTLGGLLFGATVYRYDMHEREPWWMLLGATAAGALMMAGAFTVEAAALRTVAGSGLRYDHPFVHALLAGTLEEAGKLAVPVLVLLLVRRHFNDPMDGVIYGSLAGLGAGLFEGLWYQWFVPKEDGATLLQIAGPDVTRMMMHTLWGGIDGFALGLIVIKKPWRAALARTVGTVMAIHFAWDYFVGFVEEQNNWHRLAAAGLLGASVVWYGLLVVRTNHWSRAMHAPQSKQRLTGRIVRALLKRRIR